MFTVAVVAGSIALAIASFGASTCNADPAVVAKKLHGLRVATAVIGGAVALAPAGWALLARRLKMAWMPWAAVAVIVFGLMLVAAVRTNETSTFCLF